MTRAGSAILLVLGLLLAGCGGGGVNLDIPGLTGKASDEEQITKILSDVHLGMETKKVTTVVNNAIMRMLRLAASFSPVMNAINSTPTSGSKVIVEMMGQSVI